MSAPFSSNKPSYTSSLWPWEGQTIGIVQVRLSGCGLGELPLKADSRVFFPCELLLFLHAVLIDSLGIVGSIIWIVKSGMRKVDYFQRSLIESFLSLGKTGIPRIYILSF